MNQTSKQADRDAFKGQTEAPTPIENTPNVEDGLLDNKRNPDGWRPTDTSQDANQSTTAAEPDPAKKPE